MTQNTPHITMLRDMLRELLDGGVSSCDDLVELVTTGELLRRAALLVDAPEAAMHSLLTEYEHTLGQATPDIAPPSLQADVERAVARLGRYVDTPWHERSAEDGEDCLEGIDEVLSVAAALARTGLVSQADLDTMASHARSHLKTWLGKVPELYQLAEDHLLTFPATADHGQALAFWGDLAEHAPSRGDLKAVAQETPVAVRDAVIEEVLDRREQAETTSETAPIADKGFFDRIQNWLDDLEMPTFDLGPLDPTRGMGTAGAAAFSSRAADTADSLVRGLLGSVVGGFLSELVKSPYPRVLAESPQSHFAIVQEDESTLTFRVARTHVLRVTSARYDNGSGVAVSQVSERKTQLALDREGGHHSLEVTLEIDGVSLPIPAIPLANRNA